jgi:hypothetical protein
MAGSTAMLRIMEYRHDHRLADGILLQYGCSMFALLSVIHRIRPVVAVVAA